MNTIKFVVITQPRSGSTYLVETLNSNPQLTCENELFNPRQIVKIDSSQTDDSPPALRKRNNRPIQFLQNFYASADNTKVSAIGFNFMLGHNFKVLNYLLNQEEIKIIFLERENKLGQASSWFKALDDRIWATKNSKDIQAEKISFKRFQYIGQINLSKTLDSLFKRAIKNRPNTLRVTYSDFAHLDSLLASVARFLNVDNQFQPSSLLKQNPNSLIERFANPKQVISTCKTYGLSDWLENELKQVK